MGIDFYEKFLVLSIEGLTDEEIGEITLHFHVRDNITESNTNLELYEWYIIDAQGLENQCKTQQCRSLGKIAENSYFLVKKINNEKNLKVISWNINSIRIRLEAILKIVEDFDPKT